MAFFHNPDKIFESNPSNVSSDLSSPYIAVFEKSGMINESPHVFPIMDQKACPYRYGKYFDSVDNCFNVGKSSFTSASRIHIAVFGSTLPIEKYSAMPSIIHKGILFNDDPLIESLFNNL